MMLHCALGGLGDNSFPSLFPSILLPSFSGERWAGEEARENIGFISAFASADMGSLPHFLSCKWAAVFHQQKMHKRQFH